MSRRALLAVLVALVVAAGCVRLGLWQLDRLAQRRAVNARVAARMAEPPVASLAALPADTALARFRSVRLSGLYDFEHELVLTARTRDGSPGVHILTPLRIPGEERAVLVNRGWVYSPDGSSVSLGPWREPDTATITGYLQAFDAANASVRPTGDRSFRLLDHASASARIPYPIAPWIVVATEGEASPGAPARLSHVQLGEGSHLSYAVQWFLFAVIAVVGVTVLVLNDRNAGRRVGEKRIVAPGGAR